MLAIEGMVNAGLWLVALRRFPIVPEAASVTDVGLPACHIDHIVGLDNIALSHLKQHISDRNVGK